MATKKKRISSYQKLKKKYLQEKELHVREIKTLLDGKPEIEVEKIRTKYAFLAAQNKEILFGTRNPSRVAKGLASFLANGGDQ